MIKGVNHSEITTNTSGGKQSRLDYRFDLIDANAMFELARVMYEGAQKYDKNNWRKIDAESHLNHALSHIFAHLAGDNQDDHLSHALCRCHMALAVSMQEKPDEMNCRLCRHLAMTHDELNKVGKDPCIECEGLSNWAPIGDKSCQTCLYSQKDKITAVVSDPCQNCNDHHNWAPREG